MLALGDASTADVFLCKRLDDGDGNAATGLATTAAASAEAFRRNRRKQGDANAASGVASRASSLLRFEPDAGDDTAQNVSGTDASGADVFSAQPSGWWRHHQRRCWRSCRRRCQPALGLEKIILDRRWHLTRSLDAQTTGTLTTARTGYMLRLSAQNGHRLVNTNRCVLGSLCSSRRHRRTPVSTAVHHQNYLLRFDVRYVPIFAVHWLGSIVI